MEQFIFVSAKISPEARETGECLLTPYTNFTGLNLEGKNGHALHGENQSAGLLTALW